MVEVDKYRTFIQENTTGVQWETRSQERNLGMSVTDVTGSNVIISSQTTMFSLT